MYEVLQPQQASILIALSKFRFMTMSHFIAYKVGIKNSSSLYNNLALLRDKKLVAKHSYSSDPKKGRREDIHFLTERGAEVVAEILDIPLESVKNPSRGNVDVKDDYDHRINTLSCLVSCMTWIEQQEYTIEAFDAYFDKVGSQRTGGIKSKTKLYLPNGTSVSPDAIFKYCNTSTNQSYLYCLEMYNGKDTKRINEQLRKLTYATFEGVATEKYKHNKANRNLIILDESNYVHYAIDRLNNDPYLKQFEGLDRFYLFASLEAVKRDFSCCWINLQGNKANLSLL